MIKPYTLEKNENIDRRLENAQISHIVFKNVVSA